MMNDPRQGSATTPNRQRVSSHGFLHCCRATSRACGANSFLAPTKRLQVHTEHNVQLHPRYIIMHERKAQRAAHSPNTAPRRAVDPRPRGHKAEFPEYTFPRRSPCMAPEPMPELFCRLLATARKIIHEAGTLRPRPENASALAAETAATRTLVRARPPALGTPRLPKSWRR